jgi:BolA protein
MQVQNTIEEKLAKAFNSSFKEVLNESHMHSVPPNSETHFKVTLVSDDFVGKRKVGRHQQVYSLLHEELEGPVHALALHLYTQDEWSARQGASPDSPNCLGGSKKEAQ